MELTINVHVTGLDRLADAIKSLTTQPVKVDNIPVCEEQNSANPAGAQQDAVASVSVDRPQNTADTGAPVVTPGTPQQIAPVAEDKALTYSVDELAAAAAPLMDSGKLGQLQELMARFGVPSLLELPESQYGAFATALRELGANI